MDEKVKKQNNIYFDKGNDLYYAAKPFYTSQPMFVKDLAEEKKFF